MSLEKTLDRILSSINDEDESLHLEKNLNEIRTEVNKHIDKTQKEQKQRFDKSRVKPRKFQVGDLVRVERSILCPGKSRKLIAKCLGPYTIVKIMGSDRYAAEDTPIT